MSLFFITTGTFAFLSLLWLKDREMKRENVTLQMHSISTPPDPHGPTPCIVCSHSAWESSLLLSARLSLLFFKVLHGALGSPRLWGGGTGICSRVNWGKSLFQVTASPHHFIHILFYFKFSIGPKDAYFNSHCQVRLASRGTKSFSLQSLCSLLFPPLPLQFQPQPSPLRIVMRIIIMPRGVPDRKGPTAHSCLIAC